MTRPNEIDRRKFFYGLGLAVLTVQFLPSDADADDNLTVHFSPGLFSHVHDLLVPYAVLRKPPAQGVELHTTKAMLHTHTVSLTQEQLTTINRGGTVTGKASSHRFVIALSSR